MKRPTALLAAALLTALPLFAQDGAAPADAPPPEKDQDRLELMPTRPAQLLPPPGDLPLIPEMPQPSSSPRGRSPESPIKKRDSATEDAEDAIKRRIRIREAKTKAQRDPAVQAEWDRSATMKTDYEKRAVLKNYYKLLYSRMAKVDPPLKKHIEKQLQEFLSRLEQRHIAPTQPPGAATAGR